MVGSFDAVLLLPAPTLFVWGILGLLGRPPKRSVRELVLDQTRARRLGWTVAVLGALFAGRNASQLGAMAAYGTAGRLADMERAARLDPGSYRISMLLGYVFHAAPVWVFLTACLGVLPLAGFMGDATEHLAHRTGPVVGGLRQGRADAWVTLS